ncbi:MAG: exodeoxyribonuclease VII large subunit [Prevotella sp.]|nr:exodeoxyribonuclease VII large subunit [Prevotella sp.]
MNDNIFSLYELNRMLRETVAGGFPGHYWVRAETSDVHEAQNGHCYLEFIEKDSRNKTVIAKARAAIWANVYKMLKSCFEQETGQPFVSGLKVLALVSVEFHELYGFSLNVQNIDPSYTLGDQARNRVAIIRQLEEEGVLNLNKELALPPVASRLAVVSSPAAAGYEDFCNQLLHNKSGFAFYLKLFPAVMQGDKTEESVLAALDRINACANCFDAVVIIRGGGATSELSAFDSYLLAASCAQFPLPVVTGIGHERDVPVLDMVSHTRVKTPTAAAEFFIDRLSETEEALLLLQQQIVVQAEAILSGERLRLNTLTSRFSYLAKEKSQVQLADLSRLAFRLQNSVHLFVQRQKHRIESKEQYLALASPSAILKKGYTLTLKGNSILKSAAEIASGDRITTLFKDGTKTSVAE